MRATVLLFIVIYCSLLYCSVGHPIWKVFCTTQPLYRGRADPIVDPGKLSQHGHKIWGGNNFGIGSPNISAIDYFDHIRASSCTTCSITIDLTDYWIPDLYYQWPNGSLSLVPNGGLTVYYLSRGGSGDQTNPNFQPFPAGLRMTSGSPWRRTYSGTIKEKAISYACLGGNIPEVPYFPTNGTVCSGGLRAQVWFPMCWDGKNLDAPDHQSHMSHPIERPDGGNCPATHPVRLPGVFFEILFDVNNAVFPHGTGENPFVWANGDKTGYGLHGDFLNGWDTDIVRQALADPMCDLNINPDLAFGNNVKACPPLAPYVKDSNPNGACKLSAKIPTFEDVGLSHTISHMPGCNPITSFGASVTPCWDAPTQVGLADGVRRVLLKSNVTSKFVTSADAKVPLTFNINENDNSLAYSEVFVFSPVDGGLAFFSEGTEQYVSGPSGNGGTLLANRGGVSDWEKFALVENDDGTTSIVAQSNKKYVSLQSDGTLRNSAATIGPSEKFTFVDANGKAPQPVPDQNVPDYLDSAQPRAHAIAPVVAVLALLVAMLLH